MCAMSWCLLAIGRLRTRKKTLVHFMAAAAVDRQFIIGTDTTDTALDCCSWPSSCKPEQLCSYVLQILWRDRVLDIRLERGGVLNMWVINCKLQETCSSE